MSVGAAVGSMYAIVAGVIRRAQGLSEDTDDGAAFRANHDLGALDATRDGGNSLGPLWARASLVFVPPQVFCDLYVQADRHTTEDIAGLTYHSPHDAFAKKPDEILDAEFAAHVSSITEVGRSLPFPTDVPFETTAFVYGDELNITSVQLVPRMGLSRVRSLRATGGRLLAHVIDVETASIWEVFVLYCTVDGRERAEVVFSPVYAGGFWSSPYTLMPWITRGLCELVRRRPKLVRAPAFAFKRAYQQARDRNARPTPPAFYEVALRVSGDEVVTSTPAPQHMREQRERTFRWSVVGHERVLVVRGTRPIDVQTLETLEDRKYVLVEENPAALALLEARGHDPPSETEWVALKTTWVRSHIRGPEDAPLIRSVHVVRDA